ncbi:MAG: FHA domain-containing serine/threonine-protein kinase [Thermoprotei archaeon]
MSSGPIPLGTTIDGRFRVEREIGYGGMGVVYEGYDEFQKEKIVIKTPNYAAQNVDPVFLQQKVNDEASSLSQLLHANNPYIVKFIASGAVGTVPYVVIEFIDGKRLDDYVRQKGGLDASEAYNISLKLLTALKCIHDNNMLHRDFAPDNVMIRRNGEPVVIDFGTVRTGKIVVHGTRVEKENYSPPEIVSNGTYTISSDIYMWAVTFLSMLRCRKMNKLCIDAIRDRDIIAPSIFGAYVSLGNTPCDVVDCRDYAGVLNVVFSKALDPNYNNRYQNTQEVFNDLTGIGRVRYHLQLAGRIMDLDPNKMYIIGTEGDIKIKSPYVSEKHAMLWHDRGRWILEDLCSTNGTVVIKSSGEYIIYHGHRFNPKPGSTCGSIELDCGDIIGLSYPQKDPSSPDIRIAFICRGS